MALGDRCFWGRWITTAALVALCAGLATAGNNGWFTTYNSQVERGELELMIMTDFTAPNKFRREEEGFGDYLSHMLELEYGISNRLGTEFMIEWFEDVETGKAKFTGFRWENRFRLTRGRVPLNPMIYAEYEDLDPQTRYKMEVSGWVRPPYEETESEPDRERIMETRLILSDDIGPVNIAFNWINETDISSGHTAFGYSLGLMHMVHPGGHGEEHAGHEASACSCKESMGGCKCAHCAGKGGECPCKHGGGVGLGLELFGSLGDTRSFGVQFARQEHYLGPILVYHISSRWMIHTQLAIGLSKASDNLVRFNTGFEF